VKPVTLPKSPDAAYRYVKEAVRAYPEVYFARLVVLGEGDTEEIIVPRALRLLGPTLDASGISVVPLGGRFVSHFWRLLSELDIPHVTLLDLDLGRRSGGWERIQYVLDELVNSGIAKDDLLTALGGKGLVESAADLANLGQKALTSSSIQPWVTALESYDVFFAAPLDMDFMMLTSFEEAYMATAPDGGGPRIPDRTQDPEAYCDRLDRAVMATLKPDNPDLTLYAQAQRQLMVWYVYLFLNRGKPSTHILALSRISDEQYKTRLPEPIARLRDRAKEKLADDPFSQLSFTEGQ
jgi:hypothetical protein